MSCFVFVPLDTDFQHKFTLFYFTLTFNNSFLRNKIHYVTIYISTAMIHGEVTESRNPSLPLICTCDKCMQRSERNRQMNKNIYDVLSIPDVTFFPHECCTNARASCRRRATFYAVFPRTFGSGWVEGVLRRTGVVLFFSFVRQSRRVNTARQTSVDLQKRSGRDSEGVRSNISHPRTKNWVTHAPHPAARARMCCVCARSARTSIGTTQRILSME